MSELASKIPRENLQQAPQHYKNNLIEFAPRRLWRLIVQWQHFPIDPSRALVKKTFQFMARASVERSHLKRQVEKQGGEATYFLWLEHNLFPVGDSDRLERTSLTDTKDSTVAEIVFQSRHVVSKEPSFLTIGSLWFPDPIFALHGCVEGEQPQIPAGESVGLEVVFESHDPQPEARLWDYTESKLSMATIKRWSVGEGRRIAYRVLIQTFVGMSSCPLPPELSQELKKIFDNTETTMGVEW